MDLLTHITTGIAIATVAVAFTKGSTLKKSAVVAAGALGGALPDIDAISLWSRFDSTFGKLFGLKHSGKVIYSEKFWYSHHGFIHSLVAAALLGCMLYLFIRLIKRKQKMALPVLLRYGLPIVTCFVLAYIAHLLCDMPTPASTWGGVNLMFPSDAYVGGWGKIWWWNNYDIFLITLAVIAINGSVLLASYYVKFKYKAVVSTVLAIAFVAIVIQINTRGFDFNYTGTSKEFAKYEAKSKEIQQTILGNNLYKKIERFDKRLPINF